MLDPEPRLATTSGTTSARAGPGLWSLSSPPPKQQLDHPNPQDLALILRSHSVNSVDFSDVIVDSEVMSNLNGAVDVFSGIDNEDALEWLDTLNLYFECSTRHTPGDVEKIAAAGLRLKGRARKWFSSWRMRVSDPTWLKFCEAFRAEFTVDELTTAMRVHECRQTASEPVMEYVTRLRGLLSQAGISDPKSTLAMFIGGLHSPSLRSFLKYQAPKSMDDAISHACRIERATQGEGDVTLLPALPDTRQSESVARLDDRPPPRRSERTEQPAQPLALPAPTPAAQSDITAMTEELKRLRLHIMNDRGPRPNPRAPPARQNDNDRTNVCWNCGDPGHISRECPHPRRPRPPDQQPRPQGGQAIDQPRSRNGALNVTRFQRYPPVYEDVEYELEQPYEDEDYYDHDLGKRMSGVSTLAILTEETMAAELAAMATALNWSATMPETQITVVAPNMPHRPIWDLTGELFDIGFTLDMYMPLFSKPWRIPGFTADGELRMESRYDFGYACSDRFWNTVVLFNKSKVDLNDQWWDKRSGLWTLTPRSPAEEASARLRASHKHRDEQRRPAQVNMFRRNSGPDLYAQSSPRSIVATGSNRRKPEQPSIYELSEDAKNDEPWTPDSSTGDSDTDKDSDIFPMDEENPADLASEEQVIEYKSDDSIKDWPHLAHLHAKAPLHDWDDTAGVHPFTDDLCLGETLTENEHLDFKRMLSRHRHVFALDRSELGLTDAAIHTIDTGDAKPIALRPYRHSKVEEGAIEAELDALVEEGVLRPSRSPWQAPIVMVPKKDGTLRLTIDYRRLNAVTVKDVYPMAQDHLERLGGATIFTSLDLRSGYFQVPLAPQDAPKTAFAAPRRKLEFTRLPMGLVNAPSCFQRMMDNLIVGEARTFACGYLDDCLIWTCGSADHDGGVQRHIVHVERVLNILEDANLRVHPKKCEFGRDELVFLGHKVSAAGLQPEDCKVLAVANMQPPCTVREVRSFLGFLGYYRRFVKGFSILARPLYELTKANARFNWDEGCQCAWEDLRQRVITAPILAHPDFDEPFILQTDWQPTGIGAVLAQIQDGREHVIAYGSKGLSGAELKYAPTEGECAAVVYFVRYFRHYLHGRTFIVQTDHIALKWLMETKDLTGRLARWALKLQEYDFTIKYRPGKANANADALSRLVPPQGTGHICMMRATATTKRKSPAVTERQPRPSRGGPIKSREDHDPTDLWDSDEDDGRIAYGITPHPVPVHTESQDPEAIDEAGPSLPALHRLVQTRSERPPLKTARHTRPAKRMHLAPEAVDSELDVPEDEENQDQEDDDATDVEEERLHQPNPEAAREDEDEDIPCKVCGNRRQDAQMLLCDNCDDGYHIFCLKPPLNAVPPGRWYCDICKSSSIEDITSKQITGDVTGDTELLTYLNDGIPPEFAQSRKRIREKAKKYRVLDGHLQKATSTGFRTVPPIHKREDVIRRVHDYLGHMGINRTINLINKRYWWWGMTQHVREFVSNCPACMSNRLRFDVATPMQPIEVEPYPWAQVGVDLQGPYQASASGNRYVMVVCCYFTKFPEAIPIKEKTAKTVADAFSREIICRYGCPYTVISDRGTEFQSTFEDLMKSCGIDHRLSTAYHPQTNGLVERMNRTIKTALKKETSIHPQDWDTFLPRILLGLRAAVQSSTKHAPYSLLFGRQPNLPGFGNDVLTTLAKLPEEGEDFDLFADKAVDAANKMNYRTFVQASDNIKKAQEKQKKDFDRRHLKGKRLATHVFKVGDYVATKATPAYKRENNQDWEGPYIIDALFKDNSIVQLREKQGGTWRRNAEVVTPWDKVAHLFEDEPDDVQDLPQDQATTSAAVAPAHNSD